MGGLLVTDEKRFPIEWRRVDRISDEPRDLGTEYSVCPADTAASGGFTHSIRDYLL